MRITVANRGFDVHPMHVHGHHVLVLSRDGVDATGAPLWLDTVDVRPGEVWELALRGRQPRHLDGPLPRPRPRRLRA